MRRRQNATHGRFPIDELNTVTQGFPVETRITPRDPNVGRIRNFTYGTESLGDFRYVKPHSCFGAGPKSLKTIRAVKRLPLQTRTVRANIHFASRCQRFSDRFQTDDWWGLRAVVVAPGPVVRVHAVELGHRFV